MTKAADLIDEGKLTVTNALTGLLELADRHEEIDLLPERTAEKVARVIALLEDIENELEDL